MLNLLEVFSSPDNMGDREYLACVDVTENTEADRDSILSGLKALYGSGCVYQKHLCGHDEYKSCVMEVV